jgi:calcineurin-like phosphoesterase family protein
MRGVRALVAEVGLALLLGAGNGCGDPSPAALSSDPGAPPVSDGGADPQSHVIVAAGDISCGGCAQKKTAALISGLSQGGRLAAILPLGDEAYSHGTLTDFQTNYAPSWGIPEFLAMTHPVPGNHEYSRSNGDGYFDYYNGPNAQTGIAGVRGQGYYSFDIGSWHLVALNTNDRCRDVSCDAGSPQQAWLAADLAAHPSRCALAYWHHPRFQGGTESGETEAAGPLWETFFDAGGDVVINAHEHNYQQLAPMDRLGAPDPAGGIRSFVVGTGGAGFHTTFGAPHEAAIEIRLVRTHGVLELTLLEGAYRWRFVTVDGVVPDGASGAASCH